MRRFALYGPSLIVLFTAALTLLAGPLAIRQIEAARTSATITLAQQRLDGDDLLERINQSVRDIASSVEPSVVYIQARLSDRRRGERSTGSGWVYDEKGHIVTNSHVVFGAEVIRVQFQDGRVREATFVGMDDSTDVAVVRVEPEATLLFPARRATNVAVQQGDMVFAFGSPFGFKFSMSQGIVSGLGRDAAAGGGNRYSNFIQTDAAINPGNSGGPLVDVKGRVIGMNTAIITDPELEGDAARNRSGISGGIGFAIPLETIESVVNQLVDRGIVLKGFLGVSLDDLNPEIAREIGYDRTSGVYIANVQPGLAAERAGLRGGDVITMVNGRSTPSMTVLRSAIGNRAPGETIKVTVWRAGETVVRDVTLMAAVIGADGQPKHVDHDRLFAESGTELRRREVASALGVFGIEAVEDGPRGARVAGVESGSPAESEGFRTGMVIVEVLARPVRGRDDLLDALSLLLVMDGADRSLVRVLDEDGRPRTLYVQLAQ